MPYSAADEATALEALLISLGGRFDSAYTLPQVLYAQLAGDQDAIQRFQAEAEAKKQALDALQGTHPYATMAGEFIGDTALLAPLAPIASGLSGIRGAGALGTAVTGGARAATAATAVTAAKASPKLSGEVTSAVRALLDTGTTPAAATRLKNTILKSGDLGRKSYTKDGLEVWGSVKNRVQQIMNENPALKRQLERDRKDDLFR